MFRQRETVSPSPTGMRAESLSLALRNSAARAAEGGAQGTLKGNRSCYAHLYVLVTVVAHLSTLVGQVKFIGADKDANHDSNSPKANKQTNRQTRNQQNESDLIRQCPWVIYSTMYCPL